MMVKMFHWQNLFIEHCSEGCLDFKLSRSPLRDILKVISQIAAVFTQ